jgi:hypothetical protein
MAACGGSQVNLCARIKGIVLNYSIFTYQVIPQHKTKFIQGIGPVGTQGNKQGDILGWNVSQLIQDGMQDQGVRGWAGYIVNNNADPVGGFYQPV